MTTTAGGSVQSSGFQNSVRSFGLELILRGWAAVQRWYLYKALDSSAQVQRAYRTEWNVQKPHDGNEKDGNRFSTWGDSHFRCFLKPHWQLWFWFVTSCHISSSPLLSTCFLSLRMNWTRSIIEYGVPDYLQVAVLICLQQHLWRFSNPLALLLQEDQADCSYCGNYKSNERMEGSVRASDRQLRWLSHRYFESRWLRNSKWETGSWL